MRHKDQTAAHTLASVPLNIELRRSLVGDVGIVGYICMLIDVQLEPRDDEFKWSLTQLGRFTVKSMYLDLLNDNTIYFYKYLWKMKVSLKMKIFMWFVQRKEILTKDNLLKRNWQGSLRCCFCDHDESLQHLFIKCSFVKVIWQIVYMAFNITLSLSIVHMFGNWLNGVVKSEKTNIRVGLCAIIAAIWHVRNDYIFNKLCFSHSLAGYPFSYSLNPYVVLSPIGGAGQDMNIACNRLKTIG
jgi:hypothetical protein